MRYDIQGVYEAHPSRGAFREATFAAIGQDRKYIDPDISERIARQYGLTLGEVAFFSYYSFEEAREEEKLLGVAVDKIFYGREGEI